MDWDMRKDLLSSKTGQGREEKICVREEKAETDLI